MMTYQQREWIRLRLVAFHEAVVNHERAKRREEVSSLSNSDSVIRELRKSEQSLDNAQVYLWRATAGCHCQNQAAESDASWDAARAAVGVWWTERQNFADIRAALDPLRISLQASAQDLIRRMCEVGRQRE